MSNPSIKVYDKVQKMAISAIKPYWRNPRKNEETVEALIRIIPAVGFNVPLFVDKDGVIVKGHARYKAAVRLGMKELPVIISENSEEQNRLDRVADNKLSELAEWDVPELRYELEQIDFPLEEIGFDLPKDEFMENMFAQEENNTVSDTDIQKGMRNVASEFTSDSGIKEGIAVANGETDVSDVPVGKGTIMQKVICPDCHKSFFVEIQK